MTEQRLEGGEHVSHAEGMCEAEGTECAKALRWEPVWSDASRSVSLKQRNKGDPKGSVSQRRLSNLSFETGEVIGGLAAGSRLHLEG